MVKLLHIDASVRKEGSKSRKLGKKFKDLWKAAHPDVQVIYRDVGQFPPSHPTEAFTIANYTPLDLRTPEMHLVLKQSDLLIDELLDAERLVFGIPMYNFSIPSMLKAYIDNLIRVGRTFRVTEDGKFEGLVTEKKALVISTRGATYSPPSPITQLDFQEPYLRAVFGFIGITDIIFVCAENLDFGQPAEQEKNLEQAQLKLEELVHSW
ncbi:NAD(P)H-dependent oxidoreductase [Trichocoleus sp. FACHB-90]|uniref:FMN-dependent NADH-azoreductase n=1 Tax=Cyanophyceae TaxID=3028117 RepID=UPI00168753A8|nr:NAD(P)H-dependent oxidoreductase [Trichocoleus sp. FACHB-90]MBD1929960.1 NAD(P)H-dependent oxidoreductase [Trichocoleus sp. FACHB-90]